MLGECLFKQKKYEESLVVSLNTWNRDIFKFAYSFEYYKSHLLPNLKELKPENYLKRFYQESKKEKLSKEMLVAFLVLLNRYDVLSEGFKEMAMKDRDKKPEEQGDFIMLLNTIFFTFTFNITEGNLEDSLRLYQVIGQYMQSLKKPKKREELLATLTFCLFTLQVKKQAKPEHVLAILDWFKSVKEFQYPKIFHNVWTALEDPNSVEGQRILSEKGVSELVRQLKAGATVVATQNPDVKGK